MKRRKADLDELLTIFTGFCQVARSCRQDEAFCEDVTFHQFLILDAVAKNRELNMARLHEILAVEKSTTTRLLSPLIERGLVLRNKDDSDCRAVKLSLTDEGSVACQNVRQCLEGFFQKLAGNLPASKRDEILAAVMTFIDAVKKSTSETCCSAIKR